MTKRIKISYSKRIPKGTVEFVFVKGTVTKLVEKKGADILEIGAGDFKKVDQRKLISLFRKTIRTAKTLKIKKLARTQSFYQFSKCNKLSNDEIASIFTQNAEIANFEFTKYKTVPKNGFNYVEEIIFVGNVSTRTKQGIKKGQTIGEYTNLSRTIANTPGGDLPPRKLALEAKKAAKGLKIKVTVLGEKQMKALKMEAILAVSKGSDEEAKLIVMEYWGKSENKKDPIVLVGKGITFDSGGLNIKPGQHMLDMHLDMSGGASVIAAIALAAKIGVKKNIVAIVPAVENMPNGSAYRPGDIIKSMSGKTIEVHNTDAEGRVVLADALTYGKKYKPKLMVDVATLTGAAVAALGEKTSAIMTPNKKLQDLFVRLGEESGDYMWPLPLWDEYDADIKGRFGDVANLGKTNYGGAITAGAFLKAFATDTPWVHIDMAPRMVSVPSDNLAIGSSGEPVKFFLKLTEQY